MHYPPLPPGQPAGRHRISAHRDFSLFSVLLSGRDAAAPAAAAPAHLRLATRAASAAQDTADGVWRAIEQRDGALWRAGGGGHSRPLGPPLA